MNRRQRAITAIEGGTPDRLPTCFWHHYQGLTGQDMVDAQVKFYKESQVDIFKLMCDEYFFYPFPTINKASDFANLRPLGPKHPWIEGHIERASQIVDALHGEAFTLYNVFQPLTNLKHVFGDPDFMAFLKEDEAAVLHALDVISEDSCVLVERLIKEAGIDGIFMIVQHGEPNRFTPEEYRRIASTSELRFMNRAASLSKHNVLHMCGWDGVPNRLDVWKDYPAPVFNLAVYSEQTTLAEGKKMFPNKVIMGGFDRVEDGLLCTGTPEQVRAETRRLVEEAGKDRLIISADCSLPESVPVENLRAVVEELEALA